MTKWLGGWTILPLRKRAFWCARAELPDLRFRQPRPRNPSPRCGPIQDRYVKSKSMLSSFPGPACQWVPRVQWYAVWRSIGAQVNLLPALRAEPFPCQGG